MSKKELKQRVRKLEAQIYVMKELVSAFSVLKTWDDGMCNYSRDLRKEFKKLFEPCFDNARNAHQARLEKDAKRLA